MLSACFVSRRRTRKNKTPLLRSLTLRRLHGGTHDAVLPCLLPLAPLGVTQLRCKPIVDDRFVAGVESMINASEHRRHSFLHLLSSVDHSMAETSMHDFCTSVLDALKLRIDDLEPALKKFSLPTAETGIFSLYQDAWHNPLLFYHHTIAALLGCLRIPRSEEEEKSFRSALDVFAQMIIMGSTAMDVRQESGLEMEDAVGANPDEPINEFVASMLCTVVLCCESRISILAISESNERPIDAQIQAATETCTSKKALTSVSLSSLSRLLKNPIEAMSDIMPLNLSISAEPKQHWHARTIKCLAGKGCPPLQGGKQREYISIRVRENFSCCSRYTNQRT